RVPRKGRDRLADAEGLAACSAAPERNRADTGRLDLAMTNSVLGGGNMATLSPRLNRDEAALLLVDHQVGLVVGSRLPDPETLRRNTLGLLRAAQILGVPVVATTTMEALFGPVFPELKEALGTSPLIERSKINPFDDAKTVDAIVGAGRNQLITAGVFVSVCACFPSISAAERG